jgi:hypothetical protein
MESLMGWAKPHVGDNLGPMYLWFNTFANIDHSEGGGVEQHLEPIIITKLHQWEPL